MKIKYGKSFIARLYPAVATLYNDQRGQVLPWMALAMVSLLGMGGMVVDVGHTYNQYRELQSATDAAALAAAQSLPNSTTTTAADLYSGMTGDKNTINGLTNIQMVSGYPMLKCLTTLKNEGMACSSPANANAVQVKETATVPTYFMGVLGIKTLTITTSATAAMRGSTPSPYNVAIIIDATLSMAEYDSDCGATQIACALSGVQVLLKTLTPCASSLTTCSFSSNGVAASSVDNVALFTFPNVTVGTAPVDSSCTTGIPAPTRSNGYYSSSQYGNYSMLPSAAWSGVPTAVAYTYPTVGATTYDPTGTTTGTYQLTGYLSNYRNSDSATTLNTSSALVKAVNGDSGCGGMLPPNFDGEYGTYYAGVLYAAQASLIAEQKANPGSQNVIILLSDGDATAPQTENGYPAMPSPANASGVYPSYVAECGQAVTAAKYAANAGTRVYAVAYGSEPSGCTSDQGAGAYPNITPCQTMADIASAPQNFFSDYLQSGSGSTCYSSAQPVTSLSDIFTQIAGDLTVARLIPDSTT